MTRQPLTITHFNGQIAYTGAASPLLVYACEAFAFVLNTSERRNKPHNGPEFAAAIRETFDTENPQVAAVLRELEAVLPS